MGNFVLGMLGGELIAFGAGVLVFFKVVVKRERQLAIAPANTGADEEWAEMLHRMAIARNGESEPEWGPDDRELHIINGIAYELHELPEGEKGPLTMEDLNPMDPDWKPEDGVYVPDYISQELPKIELPEQEVVTLIGFRW